MMTKGEQRIAIAEFCGWERWNVNVGSKHEPCIQGKWKCDKLVMDNPPNYPEDLNAMHEAEKRLTGEQCLKYVEELNKATKCFMHVTLIIMCMATAEQRSEALCRTLWPERWE